MQGWTAQTRRGRIARLPLRLIPSRTVVRVARGPNRGSRWVAGSGVHGYWLGGYERQHQRLLVRLLQPGDVFFDAGAHVGFYTLLASRQVGATGRVVAFEPNPRNLAFLRRHVALNRATNVTIVEAAVSSDVGFVQFDLSGDSAMGHVTQDDGGLRVASLSLDAWVAENGILPTVMKIDVEGHEPPVLEGADMTLSQGRPKVVLSVAPDSLDRCRRILEEHGYRLTPIGSEASGTEFACLPLPQ